MKTQPIQSMMHEGRQFGVIFGADKYIITNDEFIHIVNNNSGSVTLRGQYPDYKEKQYDLPDLQAHSNDSLVLSDFGHYWGIKNRMEVNYALLLQSMKKIGVSTKDMPKFGDKG